HPWAIFCCTMDTLWHLPCGSRARRSITCSYNVQAGGCDGRSTEGNSGGSRRLEVWRRLYLNNFDFLDSVLATWLCPLLSAADIHLLPAGDQFFGGFPDWQVWSKSAAIQLVWSSQQAAGAEHHSRNWILRRVYMDVQLFM